MTVPDFKRLPGYSFAAVDFYCKDCGPHTLLQRFGRNTYSNAYPERWQGTWDMDGERVHAPWNESDEMLTFCKGCKRTPDPVSRARIYELLAAVKVDENGYGIHREPI
jgi:hypothetical protein